jgi:ligand-binding sensor domain-containing protein
MKPNSKKTPWRNPRDRLRREKKLSIWLIFSAIFLFSSLHAQPRRLTFEQLSIEQGLSQSIVYCILQDRKGFLWFGTEDGLNKFDGYNFTILRHDPHQPNSLSYNEIRAMHEDSSGVLWIGTFFGGLNKYDPATERFTNYRNIPGNPQSLSHNNVRAIYEDQSGILWIGTDDGLNQFDRTTETFTRFQHVADQSNSLSGNVVNAIYKDRTRVLWVGTNAGLNALVLGNNGALPTFKHYRHDPADRQSLSNDAVNSIYEDRAGAFWIGTQNGLNRLIHTAGAKSSPSFIRYRNDPRSPNSLSHNDVRVIFEDQAGTLWLGTNGGGLNLFDREQEIFTRYQNDPHGPTSISYNQVYAICEDRSGIIWLGTYGGGANKAVNRRKPFALYRPDPNNPNSLPQEIVWAFYEDENGVLWIGTHGGGLTRFDRKDNLYTNYQHNPADPNSLSHNIVRLIYPARGDSSVLWIGTHGGGLNRFDTKTGKVTSYLYDPKDSTSISHDELRSIYEDFSGNLWIGTNGGGLNKLVASAKSSPKFIRYRHNPNNPASLSNDFVRVIYEDPQEAGEVLWIGTQGGGLNKFDRCTETFTHYRADADNPNNLNNDYILCLHADRTGVFWLGTWGGGLNRFDRDKGVLASYTTREGLPNNEVYGMLEDGDGNLWISTNGGLSRFNPQTKIFKNYSVEDGLQSNEFNGGAFFKSKSGEMFFGGIHGFNAFDPQNIKDNPHVPPVAITGFFKFNKEVRPSITAAKQLKLSYKDYVFSFEFAALDFTAPMKNQYAYKMEGLDQDWIYTGAKKRVATYTTLAPGAYTFRVKGSNNDGLWNETGTSFAIAIHPPVWKTEWFSALVVLLASGLVYFGYRERVKHVRIKAELKTAHEAQMSIMPQADPQIEGFDVSGVCLPANEVGGDFFDYLWLDEAQTKFGIAIGDVSGKAMQAAMTAVMANGMIYAKTDEELSIQEIMTRLNRPMYAKIKREMFTALCFAAINVKTKELTFTNAGLIEPLLKRGATATYLEAAGCKHPLGVTKDDIYEERKIPLQPGDALVFVTDGVTEEQNGAGEMYGELALQMLIEKLDTLQHTAKEIKDKIITEVKRFSGATQQDDDMTVIVVKVI